MNRATMPPLLDVQNLVVDYLTPTRVVRAVDSVSFDVQPGEIVGLAGESGCGKTTAAHAILRLLRPPAEISGGRILFHGDDLLTLDDKALRAFRWRNVSIVFQSAMNALNPVISIADQFLDTFQAHERISKKAVMTRAEELMSLVGIDGSRLRSYPHELSGGMRQRVVIALALALNPDLIVMDEPTTALDVVIQRDILQQIEDLQKRLNFAVLFITHDLSLLVEFSRRIAIMYAGKLVEFSAAKDLFHNPQHPYTVGLMDSFPSLTGARKALTGIPGSPPDLGAPPDGCRFNPRCPRVMDICHTVEPRLAEYAPSHFTACHLYPAALRADA
ncbi:MAG TPA: ABC transporter ATP-binding protein [Chloroflexota bacterium]|nr:ABC transporter ATP-binding protein [Chloroflexota bacterium]